MCKRGLLLIPFLAGCAGFVNTPRMRLVSSEATVATWSFVVEDRGGAAQLLIDGRPRVVGCDRAGVTLRCELRGMFPGGHTVELRLAGSVLRRSTVVGAPLPSRPLLVRVRDLDAVVEAGRAGADGVVMPAGLEQSAIEELVDGAHKASLRVFIEGSEAQTAGSVARYALDGVLGAPIDALTQKHFPSAHALWLDEAATHALSSSEGGLPLPLAQLGHGDGLLDTHGALQVGLAIIVGRGAIIDARAFPLLAVRRRHKALREGTSSILVDDGLHRAVRLAAGADAVTLVCNAGADPYTPRIELPAVPIDLLGGPMTPGGPIVPPGELAAILASPDPDRTHY